MSQNNEELRANLAAARKARSNREAEQADEAEAESMRAELRKIEHGEEGAAALAEAQTEHGADAVGLLLTNEGPIVLKKPHAATFRKFQDAGKYDSDAVDALVRPNICYPSKDKFDEINDKQPAMLMQAASLVCSLAGQQIAAISEK